MTMMIPVMMERITQNSVVYRSFIHSFIRAFMHSFARSVVHEFMCCMHDDTEEKVKSRVYVIEGSTYS